MSRIRRSVRPPSREARRRLARTPCRPGRRAAGKGAAATHTLPGVRDIQKFFSPAPRGRRRRGGTAGTGHRRAGGAEQNPGKPRWPSGAPFPPLRRKPGRGARRSRRDPGRKRTGGEGPGPTAPAPDSPAQDAAPAPIAMISPAPISFTCCGKRSRIRRLATGPGGIPGGARLPSPVGPGQHKRCHSGVTYHHIFLNILSHIPQGALPRLAQR
jgi:hypothetical protein